MIGELETGIGNQEVGIRGYAFPSCSLWFKTGLTTGLICRSHVGADLRVRPGQVQRPAPTKGLYLPRLPPPLYSTPIHHSQFTTHHSLFTIHHSRFTIIPEAQRLKNHPGSHTIDVRHRVTTLIRYSPPGFKLRIPAYSPAASRSRSALSVFSQVRSRSSRPK